MTAAMMFLSGLTAAIGGALFRSCSSGVEADLMRYWCGPQPQALLLQNHAHCAGCGALAAGFILMIAAIVMGSLPRRRIARERA